MVAHFTIRAHGVNQAFRFVEGIWLHRKCHQIRFFFGKDLVYIIRAQREMSNQPSNIKTMIGTEKNNLEVKFEIYNVLKCYFCKKKV